MKKLLTICLIMATVFAVNAQELNFDETVKYIKENLIKYRFYHHQGRVGYQIQCNIDNFKATQNGEILLISTSGMDAYMCNEQIINLFEKDKENGQEIKIRYERIRGNDYVVAFGSNYYYQLYSDNAPPDVGERLANAFNHLRSLCKKEKDPFD